jgi:hypothetical protein
MTTFATFATLRHLKSANLAPDLPGRVCAGQAACGASPPQLAKVQAVFAGQGRFAIRHLLIGGELANLEPRRGGWRTWWRTSGRPTGTTVRDIQNVTEGPPR